MAVVPSFDLSNVPAGRRSAGYHLGDLDRLAAHDLSLEVVLGEDTTGWTVEASLTGDDGTPVTLTVTLVAAATGTYTFAGLGSALTGLDPPAGDYAAGADLLVWRSDTSQALTVVQARVITRAV